jgi:hypothetical protein
VRKRKERGRERGKREKEKGGRGSRETSPDGQMWSNVVGKTAVDQQANRKVRANQEDREAAGKRN